jgi:threonine/homoserine/homoserine lactone efflux protein
MLASYFWADWAAVFLFGLLAVMTPGPDTAMILRNSLVFSRRAGAFTALGIAAGCCMHTALVLVGIGVLIAQSLLLFTVVKWAGAIYLVAVGLRTLAVRRGPAHASGAGDASATASPGRTFGAAAAFRLGLLTNLLNPKAPLLYLALFTQVVHPGSQPAVQVLYGVTVAALALAWYSALTSFLGLPVVRARLAACGVWIERAAGAVFVALGVRLALTRAQ